ncbi:hypothetical protein [Roseateles cavernae]|uniref:hypothetical protein n=1 Tax=Roseateles cavernae TaxID=3153578 RepID=UPI0032E4E8F3
MTKKTKDESAYSRGHSLGYSLGYAAGRRRAHREAASVASPDHPIAPPPSPVEASVMSAGFDVPGGCRVTLQFPLDATAEDLECFQEMLPFYLDLYRRRLAGKT